MKSVTRYVLGFDHLLEDGTHYTSFRGAKVDVNDIKKAKFFQRSHALSSLKNTDSHVIYAHRNNQKPNPNGEIKKVISIKPFLIPFVANELNREYIEVD